MAQSTKDNVKQAIKFNTDGGTSTNGVGNAELKKALESTDGLTAVQAMKLLNTKSDTSARTAIRKQLRNSAPKRIPVIQNIPNSDGQVRYFSVSKEDYQEFSKQMNNSGISFYIDKKTLAMYPELIKS